MNELIEVNGVSGAIASNNAPLAKSLENRIAVSKAFKYLITHTITISAVVNDIARINIWMLLPNRTFYLADAYRRVNKATEAVALYGRAQELADSAINALASSLPVTNRCTALMHIMSTISYHMYDVMCVCMCDAYRMK